uniref:Uncharacterized protein n=1 Tax=Rhizophora mucronata TaxID=61149 RepID=A0A2P2JSL2_RHIMU
MAAHGWWLPSRTLHSRFIEHSPLLLLLVGLWYRRLASTYYLIPSGG